MNQRISDTMFDLAVGKRITSATIMDYGKGCADPLQDEGQARRCSFGTQLDTGKCEYPGPKTRAKLLTGANGLRRRNGVCVQPIQAVARTISSAFVNRKVSRWKYHPDEVRVRKNIDSEGTPCGRRPRIRESLRAWGPRTIGSSETTDDFTDLVSFYDAAQSRSLRYRTVEIMVHPGDLREQQESVLLSSPWEESLPFQVRHVSYCHLSGELT